MKASELIMTLICLVVKHGDLYVTYDSGIMTPRTIKLYPNQYVIDSFDIEGEHIL